MIVLHIVARSIDDNLIKRIASGDAVLFIENAVFGLLQGGHDIQNIIRQLTTRRLYVLGEDLETRGIAGNKLALDIEIIDYMGFVQLTEEHTVIQSWY